MVTSASNATERRETMAKTEQKQQKVRKIKAGQKQENGKAQKAAPKVRTLTELQKLVKEVGAVETAKALTDDEVKALIESAAADAAERKRLSARESLCKDLLIEHAKAFSWEFWAAEEHCAETQDREKGQITALAIAKLILRTFKDDPERQAEVFNDLLSAQVTKAKKTFRSDELEDAGFKTENQQKAVLVIKEI